MQRLRGRDSTALSEEQRSMSVAGAEPDERAAVARKSGGKLNCSL